MRNTTALLILIASLVTHPLITYSAEEEYLLKKTKSGYGWFDGSNKPVLEFSRRQNNVFEWQNIYILQYKDNTGLYKQYVHSKHSGKLLKIYSGTEYVKVKPSPNNNFLVIYSEPGGNVYFLDKFGKEMATYKVNNIRGDEIAVSGSHAALLANYDPRKRDSILIFNQKGELVFTQGDMDPDDSVKISKNEQVLLLSGYDIWTKAYSITHKKEICRGFIIELSEDENYLVNITWGADEPFISKEYAELLGVHSLKISEAQHSAGGVYGLFINLYIIELFSLDTAELIGKTKLEGDYLKMGNYGNPLIKNVEFKKGDDFFSVTSEYKGKERKQVITIKGAKANLARIEEWAKSREKDMPRTFEGKKEHAKELNKFILYSMKNYKSTLEIKSDKQRLRQLKKQLKLCSENDIDRIIAELKRISRKYLTR
ncbi:MAG: hypothetical protein JW871_05745 [Endomicrobiales bacterium]|nr:hypothetical protein [Endomicrobiales bacterium]